MNFDDLARSWQSVKWVKVKLRLVIMVILAGGLTSTSSCIFLRISSLLPKSLLQWCLSIFNLIELTMLLKFLSPSNNIEHRLDITNKPSPILYIKIMSTESTHYFSFAAQ